MLKNANVSKIYADTEFLYIFENYITIGTYTSMEKISLLAYFVLELVQSGESSFTAPTAQFIKGNTLWCPSQIFPKDSEGED